MTPEASSTCAPVREHPHSVCEKMPDVTRQLSPEVFIDLKQISGCRNENGYFKGIRITDTRKCIGVEIFFLVSIILEICTYWISFGLHGPNFEEQINKSRPKPVS